MMAYPVNTGKTPMGSNNSAENEVEGFAVVMKNQIPIGVNETRAPQKINRACSRTIGDEAVQRRTTIITRKKITANPA